MERQALRTLVLSTLRGIAPEIDPAAIDPARPLRRQVDLDSMNWLDLMVALQQRFGVRIPESAYPRLVTLNDVLDALQER